MVRATRRGGVAMNYKEIFDQAELRWISGYYPGGQFLVNMRIKWERLCLEQSGFLPEARREIPTAWRSRLKKEDVNLLNFFDCSRGIL